MEPKMKGEETHDVRHYKVSKSTYFCEDNVLELLNSQTNLTQRLMLCCQNGRVVMLPELLTAGADVEVVDKDGNTPLSLCSVNNQPGCARLLIAAGANVNCINVNGDTPLIVSTYCSTKLDLTKLLVKAKGVDLDHVNKNGYTALLCAVGAENLNAIKLLIDAGASWEQTTFDDGSARRPYVYVYLKQLAKKKGYWKLVKFFQKHKATGQPLLLLAALRRDLYSLQLLTSMDDSIIKLTDESVSDTILQFLESVHSNKTLVNEIDIDILKLILEHTKQVSVHNKTQIMNVAVSMGNRTIIKLLSQYDFLISKDSLKLAVCDPDFLTFLLQMHVVDVNVLNRDNRPVYSGSVLEKAVQEEHLVSAEILIKNGAYLHSDSALRFAVSNKHERSVEFLLSLYSSESLRCVQSSNLLIVAVNNSSSNIIKMLLDHGADINQVHEGKCPLTAAVDVSVIELLLSRGADVNLKFGTWRFSYPLLKVVDYDFRNALRNSWLALNVSEVMESFLNYETEEVIKRLLQSGARIGEKDFEGKTALHIAARRNLSTGILDLLLTSGANINETDRSGKTPLFAAVKSGTVETVKFLLKAGADVNVVCKDRGRTVIFKAKNWEVLEMLLKFGANINCRDNEQNTVLISALKYSDYNLQYVQHLIKAGCDLNQTNDYGDSALLLAAGSVDINLLRCLVNSGTDISNIRADVSDAGTDIGDTGTYVDHTEMNERSKTAIERLVVKLWNHSEDATECINFLLDHKSSIANAHPCTLHALISSGRLSLIPKFISSGIAPACLEVSKATYAWYRSTANISPLALALFMNQTDLAHYFITIKFFIKSDISILSGNKAILGYLRYEGSSSCWKLLETFCRQPLSLETLCIIVASDALGSARSRDIKVQQTGLPPQLQSKLMFKNSTDMVISNVNTRNLFMFKTSLKQSHLFETDSDDDEDDESDSYFYSEADEF